MLRFLRMPLLADWQGIGFPLLGSLTDGAFSATISVRTFSTAQGAETRPKRPMNAYLLYLQDERPRLSPGSATEIVRTAASKWRELSENEKQPYIAKQRELQAAYRDAMGTYKALLSKEEKESFLKDFRDKKSKRQKRTLKKLRKESGFPKRNASAFAFYLSSRFAAMRVGNRTEASELFKDATNDWNSLFSHQKKEFEDKALADKERYQIEMKKYMEKMRAEGKVELMPVTYQKKVKAEERKKEKQNKA